MKKTKKQMVAAGLALVMAVSLVGCGIVVEIVKKKMDK